MPYIENHCHRVCRTTADYSAMALTGCIAVREPASWAGYDRLSAEAKLIRKITYDNPAEFLGQSPKFTLRED